MEAARELHKQLLRAVSAGDVNGARRVTHELYDPTSSPLRGIFSAPCPASFVPLLDATLYASYVGSPLGAELRESVASTAHAFKVVDEAKMLEAVDMMRSAHREDERVVASRVSQLLNEAGFGGQSIRTVRQMSEGTLR